MSFDASQQPHWSWLEGGKWKAASNLDLTASRQLGIQPGREVHLKVSALCASAWKQSWSAHVFASARVISIVGQEQFVLIDTIQSNVLLHLSICAHLFLTQLFEQIVSEQLYSN